MQSIRRYCSLPRRGVVLTHQKKSHSSVCYVDLVNQDGKSEFLVHLGDVVTGSKKQWPEAQYATVANILKRSKRPVFVVLGDNEWNDLDNPSEGLEFWNRQLRDFDQHFSNKPSIEKQKVRPENFAFVSKGVLVIGLNIVGGKVHDKEEWCVDYKKMLIGSPNNLLDTSPMYERQYCSLKRSLQRVMNSSSSSLPRVVRT